MRIRMEITARKNGVIRAGLRRAARALCVELIFIKGRALKDIGRRASEDSFNRFADIFGHHNQGAGDKNQYQAHYGQAG